MLGFVVCKIIHGINEPPLALESEVPTAVKLGSFAKCATYGTHVHSSGILSAIFLSWRQNFQYHFSKIFIILFFSQIFDAMKETAKFIVMIHFTYTTSGFATSIPLHSRSFAITSFILLPTKSPTRNYVTTSIISKLYQEKLFLEKSNFKC